MGDLLPMPRRDAGGAREPMVKEGRIAELLAVEPRTVRRYREQGMPSYKGRNGSRRYVESECLDWWLSRD